MRYDLPTTRLDLKTAFSTIAPLGPSRAVPAGKSPANLPFPSETNVTHDDYDHKHLLRATLA